MRQTSSPVNKVTNGKENPDDILGQFYFAFGQGAGAMRVRREAIAALRRRYLPGIQRVCCTWEEVSGNVLSLLAQVGRLSALIATQRGSSAISAHDFMAARRLVEARVHKHHVAEGLSTGPVCSSYPEDEFWDNPSSQDTAWDHLENPTPEEPGQSHQPAPLVS